MRIERRFTCFADGTGDGDGDADEEGDGEDKIRTADG
jgi:hypothetical protein